MNESERGERVSGSEGGMDGTTKKKKRRAGKKEGFSSLNCTDFFPSIQRTTSFFFFSELQTSTLKDKRRTRAFCCVTL